MPRNDQPLLPVGIGIITQTIKFGAIKLAKLEFVSELFVAYRTSSHHYSRQTLRGSSQYRHILAQDTGDRIQRDAGKGDPGDAENAKFQIF